MRLVSAGLTHVGQRRLSNEDALIIDDAIGLYAVADGMGGHAAGEVASREALETLHAMLQRGKAELRGVAEGNHSPSELRKVMRLLESAVQGATYMVFAVAEHDPEQHGMGTTLSALLICGGLAFTAQVGDSRIYHVRDGKTEQITEDHTLIAWQLKQGLISEVEAANSPHKNVITRAVGSHDYVQVDTSCVHIRASDLFLLCSDGLHGYLEQDEISPIIAHGPDKAVKEFIDVANERGGRDNITAIVVKLLE